MLVPKPHVMNETHFSVSGDVTIHPSAAIAPGVLLRADPNTRLVIAAGVSIGSGSILHVCEAELTIEANACLGSGVLIVGSGKIGANACIGSMTTIVNSWIEAGHVIPPDSLIGDLSRQLAPANIVPVAFEPESQESVGNVTPTSEATVPILGSAPDETQAESIDQSVQPDTAQKPKVYGLESFNELIVTLFPHRQALTPPLNQTTSALNQTPE